LEPAKESALGGILGRGAEGRPDPYRVALINTTGRSD